MKCILILKKNYCWIWITVDRLGKKFINCVLGSRGTKTRKKLWKLIETSEIKMVMTDYWKEYNEFIPKDKHIASKAETFTVEGYNRLLRHYLARFRRKTKCYSKSIETILYSLILLMAKRNNIIETIFS